MSDEPPKNTVDPETNPDPLTMSVNPDPPAVAEFGLRPEMEGIGTPSRTVTVPLVALAVARS